MRWLPLLLLAACAGEDPAEDTDDPTAGWNLGTDASTDSFLVSYDADPNPVPPNEHFVLAVTVTDLDGASLPDASLVVDATMPEHQHGMNTVPETKAMGDGAFEVEGMLFHMTGHWQLAMEVTDGGVTETATFDIDCCEF